MISLSSILKAKSHYEFIRADIDSNITNKVVSQEIDINLVNITNEKNEDIIRQAIKKAQHIENEARKRADTIVENAINNSQKIMSDSEKKGYDEGYLRGLVDGANASEMAAEEGLYEINNLIIALKTMYKDIVNQQENELIKIAFEIAKKIIKHEMNIDENLILKMLEEVIQENEGSIKIYLSEYQKSLNIHLDKAIINRIRNISKDAKVVLVKEEDIIMVETENGIVDVSVPVQLEQLIKAVENAS